MNKANIDGNGNIVIQDSDNSEIIINTNNPEEIRKFFIDFQDKLGQLPKNIIDIMESKNSHNELIAAANVYLGLDILYSGTIQGIAFGVTVTNLTKEHRYFNTPFFKSSVPFEGENDTFLMTSPMNDVVFPKRLEYGEVFKQNYKIVPRSKEIYEKMFSIDQKSTIQVIVNTTIGEIYKSNEYKVANLLDSFKHAV
jgi:hypothetical protein